jgi:hypothetical protein
MIRFGVAGHRKFNNKRVIDFMTRQYINILSKAKKQNISVTAVSAIAEGADTFFAEAAISLNIPLEIVLPFAEYDKDFITNDSLTRYENLCGSAVRKINLPFNKRSNIAYQAAMHWIVDNCDVLIAAWDGKNTGKIGGTKDAIDRAIRFNRSWIHLNVTELSVDFYYSG